MVIDHNFFFLHQIPNKVSATWTLKPGFGYLNIRKKKIVCPKDRRANMICSRKN